MHIKVENAENIKIQHPEDTYGIIRKIFYDRHHEVDLMKEHFWTISLNRALKILSIELVGIGCKDRFVADPGDVFRVPLYKSSSYIILAHNHPSGSLKPSETDLDFTNKLIKAGDILDINVIDHVIVTEKSFYSLEASGYIEQLRWDTKYAISSIYERKVAKRMEQLKKEVEKEGKKRELAGIKKGKQEGYKEIIKRMLSKGKTVQEISEDIGIPVSDVQKLAPSK